MKQYRYILNDRLTLEEMIAETQELPEYVKGQKGLLQMLNYFIQQHIDNYGGEEFIMILPYSSEERAKQVEIR